MGLRRHIRVGGGDGYRVDKNPGDDDTLVTSYYSLRDVRGGITQRVLVMGFTLALICSASFATTNILLDKLQLRPVESQQEPKDHVSRAAVPSERFVKLRQALLNISGEDTLSDIHTPQMRALDWLSNLDGLLLDPESPNLVQRYVLAVLFFSTSELGWHRDLDWLTSKHECEWNGDGGIRSCSPDSQVTDISLWNNLKGTIPNEIGQLTKLQILYLARNQLRGTIPTEIGLLTDLTYIGLQHNRLTGTVPSLHMGNMTKLRTLYLEKNDLNGTIRRVDPLCRLKFDAEIPKGQRSLGGVLKQVTSDCTVLVSWKTPEIVCSCCSRCYAA